MKKLITVGLICAGVVLAGCQLMPTDDNENDPIVVTGNQNQTTGGQTTGTATQTGSTEIYHFSLNGTEPFWGVDISGGNAVISMPSDNAPTYISAVSIPVSKYGTTQTIVFADPASSTVITLIQGSCSDGMGPTQYDYTSYMIFSGTSYQGCAKTQ